MSIHRRSVTNVLKMALSPTRQLQSSASYTNFLINNRRNDESPIAYQSPKVAARITRLSLAGNASTRRKKRRQMNERKKKKMKRKERETRARRTIEGEKRNSMFDISRKSFRALTGWVYNRLLDRPSSDISDGILRVFVLASRATGGFRARYLPRVSRK